jgi:hypothetical protein
MKRTAVIAIACALGLGLTATNARADIALTYCDSFCVGFVQGSNPQIANETDEAAMINSLITVAAGDSDSLSPPAGETTYWREDSSLPGPFPSADATGVTSVQNVSTGIVVVGSAYIAAKYDGPNIGHVVWFVPSGTYSIPTELVNPITGVGPQGLSHHTVFPTGGTVPDGGVTLMLLGGALFGLESLRRRFRV